MAGLTYRLLAQKTVLPHEVPRADHEELHGLADVAADLAWAAFQRDSDLRTALDTYGTALDATVAARTGVGGTTVIALVAAERALLREGVRWGYYLALTAARAGEGWAAWANAAAVLREHAPCDEWGHIAPAFAAVEEAERELRHADGTLRYAA